MSEVQVMIHVRFAPDGTVTEIGERPAGVTAQAWSNQLSQTAGGGYQALAGGRGIYRLTRSEVDAIKSALVPQPQA